MHRPEYPFKKSHTVRFLPLPFFKGVFRPVQKQCISAESSFSAHFREIFVISFPFTFLYYDLTKYKQKFQKDIRKRKEIKIAGEIGG